MKITKFLRKRITKDEKQARKAIKERERRDYVNPAGALAPEHTLQSWPDFGVPAMRVGPERVLAECAAKRRIIEECEVFYEDGLADGKPVTSGATLALNVLSALAEAYAHHPDFDHAWTDGDGLRAL